MLSCIPGCYLASAAEGQARDFLNSLMFVLPPQEGRGKRARCFITGLEKVRVPSNLHLLLLPRGLRVGPPGEALPVDLEGSNGNTDFKHPSDTPVTVSSFLLGQPGRS